MGITLKQLELCFIAGSDLANGDAQRAVDAEAVRIELGSWRAPYDGVAPVWLLLGIEAATRMAMRGHATQHFSCLDAPDGGQMDPLGATAVRVKLHTGEVHEVEADEIHDAVAAAIGEIADFMAARGFAQAPAILRNQLASCRVDLRIRPVAASSKV